MVQIICRSCQEPVRFLSRQESEGASSSRDGIHIDGVGVGAPAGIYHVGCLGFCPVCQEVEETRYLVRHREVCRLCVGAQQEAVGALWRALPARPRRMCVGPNEGHR